MIVWNRGITWLRPERLGSDEEGCWCAMGGPCMGGGTGDRPCSDQRQKRSTRQHGGFTTGNMVVSQLAPVLWVMGGNVEERMPPGVRGWRPPSVLGGAVLP
ncbi:hypothetical protein Vafri_18433 [Volvox africanus]|uniref:Uncharacterized protein n=1 Tax=Volvox africanus TaxID=51714 RepID=A0A8J4BM53_9CHLO|nr:hypothetical protein Vafri_18433 [Volvox africanus]